MTRTAAREPRYYAVKRHLLGSIDTLAPGRAVPTERELAAELGTSRTTVRQALVELVAEGRLVRRQGSGTYVAEPKLTWPLHLASFTEQAAANGMTASTQLVSTERVTADLTIAERLGIGLNAPVYRFERLRLADESPVALETVNLPARRFPGVTRRMRIGASLYAVLAEMFDVHPESAEESIATTPAPPREAALLDADTGTPMLLLCRQTFDADGVPIEWVTSWYRGDRITFTARLAKQRLGGVAL